MNDADEWFLNAMAAALFAIVVLMIGLIYDTIGISAKSAVVTTIERKEAVTSTTLMPIGRTLIPMSGTSQNCKVYFQIEGKMVTAEAGKSFCKTIQTGDQVQVLYGKTRLRKKPRATNIALLKE